MSTQELCSYVTKFFEVAPCCTSGSKKVLDLVTPMLQLKLNLLSYKAIK